MSLDANRLALGFKSALVAAGADGSLPATTTLALDLATAVVTEFTEHAQVVPTALVAPSGGGPVTGTGGIE